MSEIHDTFFRISSQKGVKGIIVVNSDGLCIKSTVEEPQSSDYARLITELCGKARHVVRDLDPTNDLMFLRIRSKRHEIMVAPDKDFTLIVIQDPRTQ